MTFQMALRYCVRGQRARGQQEEDRGTHVGLDVEVLEVEGVLPDVDADEGDVAEERVLVRGGGELDALGGGVVALQEGEYGDRSAGARTRTSQPQPEPWMAAVVVLNSFLKLSKEPKLSTMAFLRGPSWRTPPVPLPSAWLGARFFQKREWLMWPPPLNLRAAWRAMRSLGVLALA